jgi:hypothetical protein
MASLAQDTSGCASDEGWECRRLAPEYLGDYYDTTRMTRKNELNGIYEINCIYDMFNVLDMSTMSASGQRQSDGRS